MTLRVVAGALRGRRLSTLTGDETRPTSDRVREAIFNSLDAQGVLVGATVLDLFAGSGAMGIEALSRGAAHVTFVDVSARAQHVVTDNVERCGLAESVEIVRSEALRYVRRSTQVFDLALLDPPYDFPDWNALLAGLNASVIVIESDRSVLGDGQMNETVEQRFRVIRERRYGTTVVQIATRQADSDLNASDANSNHLNDTKDRKDPQ